MTRKARLCQNNLPSGQVCDGFPSPGECSTGTGPDYLTIPFLDTSPLANGRRNFRGPSRTGFQVREIVEYAEPPALALVDG